MSLPNYIKNLEKKKIISRKPHPAIPFLLASVTLIFGIITPNTNKFFTYASFILAGFAFIFAILHLIVVRILEN